jgi:4-carboxymuconolactone decarboxylase
MEKLSLRERELVAIGAAMGSNCIPCVEYHIAAGKKAGLTDKQIQEAIRVAEMVRKVPADKVLATALELTKPKDDENCQDPDCACHQKQSEKDANPCCS